VGQLSVKCLITPYLHRISRVIRSRFRGLKWIFIQFMPHFFYYACFACVWVFLQISSSQAQLHVIRRWSWGRRWSRKLTKEAQNDPTETKPMAQVEARKEHKTQWSGKEQTEVDRPHHGLPMGPTMARGGWRTAVRGLVPWFLRFLLRLFVFWWFLLVFAP